MQVISLYDKTTGSLYKHDDSVINIDLEKGKLWRISCNGRILTKSMKYNVTYACASCQRHNTVTLCLFYKRLAKNRTTCETCEEQRALEMMPNCQASEIIKISQERFETMDDDFKDLYKANYLMKDDYERIKPHIVSFQHDKFPQNGDIEYIPILIINNHSKFYPSLYHKPTDTLQKCMYIVFKCEECQDNFTSKNIEVHKNHHRILCKTCADSARLLHNLKTLSIKNIINEPIAYRCKLELKLITHCQENKVLIQNGPYIEYLWNGITKSFRAGLLIPDLGYLVIVIAHNNDPITKRDNEKHKAAIAYCSQYNLEFRLVLPKIYMKLINELRSKLKQKQNINTKYE